VRDKELEELNDKVEALMVLSFFSIVFSAICILLVLALMARV